MQTQEIMKAAYDSGFVASLVQMGLVPENFEKTAEEKGRAIDAIEDIINISQEDSRLLKTAYEYGEMQALKDLGLISSKQSEELHKTASDQGLKSSLGVIEGIKTFFLNKTAEYDDVPPIPVEGQSLGKSIGKGAITAGQAGVQTGKGLVGGGILGGLGGGVLGGGLGAGAGYGIGRALGKPGLGAALATLLGLGGAGAGGYGGLYGGALLGGLEGAEKGLGTAQKAIDGPGIDPRMLQGM